MPLRDHFHPPLLDAKPWDGLHGAWPAVIVMDLNQRLPPPYSSSPHIQLGNVQRQDEYEVQVFDTRDTRLVAAIEIVSPANKDRAEHRQAFCAKCAAMIQQGISVSIVDLVSSRRGNLYAQTLDLLGESDASITTEAAPLYAATARRRRVGELWKLEAWTHGLGLGLPLPMLPVWLSADRAVPLDLEQTYEQTCQILRIR
jgi:hypothetical protein